MHLGYAGGKFVNIAPAPVMGKPIGQKIHQIDQQGRPVQRVVKLVQVTKCHSCTPILILIYSLQIKVAQLIKLFLLRNRQWNLDSFQIPLEELHLLNRYDSSVYDSPVYDSPPLLGSKMEK